MDAYPTLPLERIAAPHGTVEGILQHTPQADKLIIITHGHNGFCNYGVFPYLQEMLREEGVSSFSYNFSHGGVSGLDDHFSDLEAYSKNCMRLQTADLIAVGEAMHQRYPGQELWLLSHSMGAVANTFGARQLIARGIPIRGLVYLAPISQLDFWSSDLIDTWSQTGTIHLTNRRTGQDLPHGPELLAEIRAAATDWHLGEALSKCPVPTLVIHGQADESVPIRHGQQLYRYAVRQAPRARFIQIAGTGHTFGTAHPFNGLNPAVKAVLYAVLQFISD
jgi:pimeloyl-ACP methyl ester carboxylesterase